jgi:DNA-binding CsgD family transcriptional regulator
VVGRGGHRGVRAPARPGRGQAESATDREVSVVAAVVAAGSEKAAAHRLGLSHSTVKHHLAKARSKLGAETTAQLVWILAPRLPEAPGDDDGETASGQSSGDPATSGTPPTRGE